MMNQELGPNNKCWIDRPCKCRLTQGFFLRGGVPGNASRKKFEICDPQSVGNTSKLSILPSLCYFALF